MEPIKADSIVTLYPWCSTSAVMTRGWIPGTDYIGQVGLNDYFLGAAADFDFLGDSFKCKVRAIDHGKKMVYLQPYCSKARKYPPLEGDRVKLVVTSNQDGRLLALHTHSKYLGRMYYGKAKTLDGRRLSEFKPGDKITLGVKKVSKGKLTLVV
jgi:hypothetical protein